MGMCLPALAKWISFGTMKGIKLQRAYVMKRSGLVSVEHHITIFFFFLPFFSVTVISSPLCQLHCQPNTIVSKVSVTVVGYKHHSVSWCRIPVFAVSLPFMQQCDVAPSVCICSCFFSVLMLCDCQWATCEIWWSFGWHCLCDLGTLWGVLTLFSFRFLDS